MSSTFKQLLIKIQNAGELSPSEIVYMDKIEPRWRCKYHYKKEEENELT